MSGVSSAAYMITRISSVTLGSSPIGSVGADGIKLKVKFKEISFGPTQETPGLAKLTKYFMGAEIEIPIDEVAAGALAIAWGGGDQTGGDQILLTVGTLIRPIPAALVITCVEATTATASPRVITITNVVPTSETWEHLIGMGKQSRCPMKFETVGVATLLVHDHDVA